MQEWSKWHFCHFEKNAFESLSSLQNSVLNCMCIITRHSLVERRARYLFYCMFFVCFFVCSVNDFSTTRGPIHAKVRMQAYSPAGGKKGQMKFSLVWEFLHFGGFWAISQQRLHGSTPNIICVETMFADVPPPLWGPSAPGGGKEGELKTQKIRGGLIRA